MPNTNPIENELRNKEWQDYNLQKAVSERYGGCAPKSPLEKRLESPGSTTDECAVYTGEKLSMYGK